MTVCGKARLAALAAATLAAAVSLSVLVGAAAAAPEAAIPGGRDDFLADMMGRGETLPGGCKFSGGGVERTFVTARYSCGTDEVVFRLTHPDAAPADAARTRQFALVVQYGTPPPGLSAALIERIRAREGGFEWVWPHGPKSGPLRVRIVPTLAGLATLVALGIFLRRRRRRAAAG